MGKAFDDPAARHALYGGVRATHRSVELAEMDNHINEVEFAEAGSQKLLCLIRSRPDLHTIRSCFADAHYA
jgi:hypothetical protein